MFDISLIMATLGRSLEIGLYIKALLDQRSDIAWELIIVDQNESELVSNVLAEVGLIPGRCSIRHIRIGAKGLSNARNVGLLHATAGIIAFPDDDCIYSRDVLDFIVQRFSDVRGKTWDVVTLRDVTEVQALEKWASDPPVVRTINGFNILRRAISYTIFVRNRFPQVRFDEAFGLGAKYGAAEETDYLFRLHLAGAAMCQISGPVVFHPDKKQNFGNLERAFGYSIGTGAFFRKHFSFRSPLLLLFCVLSTVRLMAIVSELSLRRRRKEALWYSALLRGRLSGFRGYRRAAESAKIA